MTPTATEKKSKRRQRIRIILWSLLVVTLSAAFVSLMQNNFVIGALYGWFLLSGVIVLICLAVTSKHYYNYGISIQLIIISTLLIGFMFYRYLDQIASDVIMNIIFNNFYALIAPVSFLAIFVFFLVYAFRLFFLFPNNKYIQWFGFFVGISVVLAFFNVFMIMGSLRIDNIAPSMFNYLIMMLIIILSLALIFMLPLMEYSSWFSTERKVLYRMILSPLAVVLVINILFNVFPDFLPMLLLGNQPFNPWWPQEVELLKLEGLSPTTQ